MAGECEEPFGISFQADLLHSGSISFGRFETEDLSWERRSSFPHNRYLEEVEKCSRPGSVIEKKAYFEAHFKKKGIRLPGSLEFQSGKGYQSCERDVSENVENREENDIVIESSDYACSDEGVQDVINKEKFPNNDEGGQFDYVHDNMHYADFGEKPEVSECNGECKMVESGREDPGILYSGSQMEAALDNFILLKGDNEAVKTEGAHRIESRSDELHLDGRQETELKHNFIDNATIKDELSRPVGPPPNKEAARQVESETNALQPRNLLKLRAAKESKSVKPRMMSGTSASQIRKSNTDAEEAFADNQYRMRRKSQQRTKPEKQLPQAAMTTRQSLPRTLKDNDSGSSKARSCQLKESEKEPRIKKTAEIRHSGSNKVQLREHRSANRVKHITISSKPGTMSNGAIFNFRGDQRPERRKEFFVKLEEKMHGKEAEMNQIQARTQEKAEAEFKQFRKSLNFKATPMPSFYQMAVPRGSNANKAVLSKNKPAKVHRKTTGPAGRIAFNSQMPPKTGNYQTLAPGESVETSDPSESCGTTDFPTIDLSNASQTPPTNYNSHPERVMKHGFTGKEKEKVRESNWQKHRVSDRRAVPKDQKVESKPKVGKGNSSSEMVRRSMKGSGVSRTSGMGRLAVGVAS